MVTPLARSINLDFQMPESTIRITRTTAANPDFLELIPQLDKELAITDGDEHDFYDQFNGLENIDHVILVYAAHKAVACGALKEFDSKTMEVKRMFTLAAHRGNGHASQVLQGLENWATELGYERCILETGLRQPVAIAVYKKSNYSIIPNYGQYEGKTNSVCFEKRLS